MVVFLADDYLRLRRTATAMAATNHHSQLRGQLLRGNGDFQKSKEMKILYFPLKKEWYSAIESGDKREVPGVHSLLDFKTMPECRI